MSHFPVLTPEIVALVTAALEESFNGTQTTPGRVWLALGRLSQVDRAWREGADSFRIEHVRTHRALEFNSSKAINSIDRPGCSTDTFLTRPLPLPPGLTPNPTTFLLDTAEDMLKQDPAQSRIAWLLRCVPTHPRTSELMDRWVSPERAANHRMRFASSEELQGTVAGFTAAGTVSDGSEELN